MIVTDLVQLAGGAFRMGSDEHYPEEAPAHQVAVSPFSMRATTVTNAQFAEFVDATGYVTVAERAAGTRPTSPERRPRTSYPVRWCSR